MKPHKRNYRLYPVDTMTSITCIEEYIQDMNFEESKSNPLVVDAVIRDFEIIGEASKNIPHTFKENHPKLPWKKMYGLRNLISHVYFGVDHELIWEITKNSFPKNKLDLQEILDSELNK